MQAINNWPNVEFYYNSKGFDLERGMFIEDTERKHYTVEEYKKITNFENTKKVLKDIKLDLPEVPDISSIGKFTRKRDEKILDEIIKPKDDLIKELYKDNLSLHRELSKQSKVISEAEKYQKERDLIIADNQALHSQVANIAKQFHDKEFDLEWKYKNTIKTLEKENKKLHKVIDKFKETITKFIKWICKKFELPSEDEVIRDFEKETHTLLDVEKQLNREKKDKEFEIEL